MNDTNGVGKYDTWKCARCGRRFGVTEPMHECYQRPYVPTVRLVTA